MSKEESQDQKEINTEFKRINDNFSVEVEVAKYEPPPDPPTSQEE